LAQDSVDLGVVLENVEKSSREKKENPHIKLDQAQIGLEYIGVD
jgi:hypothetical protein